MQNLFWLMQGDASQWLSQHIWQIIGVLASLGLLLYRIGKVEQHLSDAVEKTQERLEKTDKELEKLKEIPIRVDRLETRSVDGQVERIEMKKVLDRLDELIEGHCRDGESHLGSRDHRAHDETMTKFANLDQAIMGLSREVAALTAEVRRDREHRR